jgi:hypothetical protein
LVAGRAEKDSGGVEQLAEWEDDHQQRHHAQVDEQ